MMSWLREVRRTIGVLFAGMAVLSVAPVTGVAVAGEAAAGGGELILDQGSVWSFFMAGASQPAIQTAKGVEKGDPAWAKGLIPDGWTAAEFDDHAWGRSPGPFFGPSGMYGFNSRWMEASSGNLALLCVRGKFDVSKPAEMSLGLEYRGGIVVYVNGKEVARQNLPKEGLEPGTLADPYPREVFVDGGGKILEGHEANLQNANYRPLFEKRIRRLSVKIPATALRTGANVLAVEIHRSPYDEACLIGPKRLFYNDWSGWTSHGWSTAGLTWLELRGASGSATPNTKRPKGFQVWNANPMRGVYDMDYGLPGEKLGPIELVGTRNGAFSGQVVVSCDAPIKGLKGVMGDLKQAQGGGVIPAAAVEVRYAGFTTERDGMEEGSAARYRKIQVKRFDSLIETPPEEVQVWRHKDHGQITENDKDWRGAVQPVWVTVNVPADAKPGQYAGTLTLSAAGLPETAVPVKIDVQNFKLPDPKNYVTFMDFVPSPETLALWYQKEHYSDAHFALMEKTFKQIGKVGQKVIWMEMIARSNNGNSQSMVRWIKQADGTYKYDFTVFDRYLDMAQKYVTPKYVVLYMWDFAAGSTGWDGKHFFKKDEYWDKPCVSELDPATGKVKEKWLTGPTYWDEAAAEKFWRPMLEEAREHLKKRGLYEKTLWGEGFENFTGPCAARVLNKILPEVKGWSLSGHMAWHKVGDFPVIMNEHCYSFEGGSKYGWDPSSKGKDWDEVYYHRDAWFSHPLTVNRNLPEQSMKQLQHMGEFTGLKGMGRMGADFWQMGIKGQETRGFVANRYPENIRIAREITSGWLAPGPNGPVSSVRFEMCREGLQELEARIFIEQNVLANESGKAAAGDDLVKRCQNVLKENSSGPLAWGTTSAAVWYPTSGWQAFSGRRYAVAAEVAAKLGK